MANQLTPEQQQLLEAFQAKAQAAHDAAQEQMRADGALAAAMTADDAAWSANSAAHQGALDAAQQFIDALTGGGGQAGGGQAGGGQAGEGGGQAGRPSRGGPARQ